MPFNTGSNFFEFRLSTFSITATRGFLRAMYLMLEDISFPRAAFVPHCVPAKEKSWHGGVQKYRSTAGSSSGERSLMSLNRTSGL